MKATTMSGNKRQTGPLPFTRRHRTPSIFASMTPAAAWILFSVVFLHAAIPITATPETLPAAVDNRDTPYFPPIIAQVGESCSNANSVGYIFTYEIDAARNLPAADSTNRYPYFWTYDFLNGGSELNGTHTMFVDAWHILQYNGAPNTVDFGPVDSRSTKWMSGYDRHYNAMHNRVADIDSLSFLDDGTFTKMKQWLFDHGNGSPTGGIFTITVSAFGVQDASIKTGPHQGSSIVLTFGKDPAAGPHTLAVVGYDDAILYDFNKDGIISDDLDINSDGEVSPADWEHGAFICANTWGESSGDNGFIYAPYRLFVTPSAEGGTLSNRAYFITVKREYAPVRTLKTTITHNQRNTVALSVGIAADTAATEPEILRPLPQFTYAGGNLPMCGYAASPTIELGLDVTDLADSIAGFTPASYFLVIETQSGTGRCEALSLLDYSGTSAAFNSPDAPLNLVAGKNILRVIVPPAEAKIPPKENFAHSTATVSRSGNCFRLYLPPESSRIRLLALDGSVVASFAAAATGQPFLLPVPSEKGIYVICISGKNGVLFSTIITTTN